MSIWDTASAAIAVAFADPEAIVYTGAGLVAAPIAAVRLDDRAPDFTGVGQTMRRVGYEVRATLFPAKPGKGDTFTHRGRIWHVQQTEYRPEIGAWELTVSDGGPA